MSEKESMAKPEQSRIIDWTGERYVPWVDLGTPEIHYEHLHRYHFASQFVQGKKVLDLASGEGYGCAILAEQAAHVVGVELDEKTVRHAASSYPLPNIEFIHGSITDVPIQGERIFDIITCFEAIEHIEEQLKLISEAKRLLKDDGLFIISSPNRFLYSDKPGYENLYHKRELYFDEFRNLLNKRFTHVRFLGQKVLPVSAIWPLGEDKGDYKDFCIRKKEKGFVPVGSYAKLPLYFIAIASQAPLPDKAYFSTMTDVTEELINQLRRVIVAKDQLMVVKEGEFAAERERLEAQLANLREQITHVQDLLAQKEQCIVMKEHELRSQREKFHLELKKVLAEKEHLLAVKAQELEAERKILEKLDDELAHLRKQLADKENEILLIDSSLGWHIIKSYRRFADRVFPDNTRQRRIYEIGQKALKILFTEGPRRLFIRVNQWLSKRWKLRRKDKDVFSLNGDLHVPSAQDKLVVEISPIRPVQKHNIKVDIIVCVHNALEDAKRCLESIIMYTSTPYRLILIDDGSDEPTHSFLEDFASHNEACLIQNEIAKGYTRAANQGLKESTAEYVLLLNSDTIVTPEWLDRLLDCAQSDNRIGIVGPLSNTASWQSVPDIFNNGDWAQNPLPPGMRVSDMGRLIAKYSGRLYPRIPFLNGFCLLIKRQVINDIGYFDEETFGEGYGEENDYCLRAQKAGWKLAVADDVYIFHAQSRSYSHERRRMLSERANVNLTKLYGEHTITEGVRICRYNPVLEGIRARAKVMIEREQLIIEAKKRWEGKRVLFILPVIDPGGGANVVIQEAKAMLKMGIDARILNLPEYRKGFETSYPDLDIPVIYSRVQEIRDIAYKFDAIIATLNSSVEWLNFDQKDGLPVKGYYVQDFEPYFYQEGSQEFWTAWKSYDRFPNLVRFTKTEWNRSTIMDKIGVDSKVVGPSVFIDLFRVRPRRREAKDRSLYVAAMVRPSSPRRNPYGTMQVLREAWRYHKHKIKIIVFGCTEDDPDFRGLPKDFDFLNVGVLTRAQLASLLNEIDIFVDLSLYQAMGLTALEAMACGAAVIVPEQGGSTSFATHERNSLIVNTNSTEDCLGALERLITNEDLRISLQRQAIRDACLWPPEKAAFNILRALFESQ